MNDDHYKFSFTIFKNTLTKEDLKMNSDALQHFTERMLYEEKTKAVKYLMSIYQDILNLDFNDYDHDRAPYYMCKNDRAHAHFNARMQEDLDTSIYQYVLEDTKTCMQKLEARKQEILDFYDGMIEVFDICRANWYERLMDYYHQQEIMENFYAEHEHARDFNIRNILKNGIDNEAWEYAVKVCTKIVEDDIVRCNPEYFA